MKSDTAIIQPDESGRTFTLGPVVIMVSPVGLLKRFKHQLGFSDDSGKPFYHSQLYYHADQSDSVALVGPMMGAPYATAILETLVARGARTIIFAGWCGAIDSGIEIGDILVPDMALSGEGTSPYYSNQTGALYPASAQLGKSIKTAVSGGASVHGGTIWTTDALFRETSEIISGLQKKGVVAVEMELSALFAAARFRQVEVTAVLVVSDHLGDLTWRPGFKDSGFKKTNQQIACQVSRWAMTHAAQLQNS